MGPRSVTWGRLFSEGRGGVDMAFIEELALSVS